MRKSYVKPAITSEIFNTENYCASCEHKEDGYGGKYYFECNAGYRDYKGQYPYKIYYEDGTYITNYEPCGDTHEADTDGVFKNGYMDDRRTQEVERIPVIIWVENPNNPFKIDYHCTTNLNRDTWKKNIS